MMHPKVRAGANVAGVVAAVFTVLAAVGIVVPDDVQNAASVVAVDIAAAVPVVAGWLKSA